MLAHPYDLFWTMIPLVLLCCSTGRDSVDVQLHDTYFVIASRQIGSLVSVYLGVCGVVYYWLANCQWVEALTGFHLVAVVLVVILLACYLWFSTDDYVPYATDQVGYRPIWTWLWAVAIFLLATAHIGFLVNVLIAVLRGDPPNSD